jgi:peptidyl-prolyl cis-trans isomerase SurA
VSAEKGGVIGWILEGQLGFEIEAALAKIEVGAYTDPIRTFEGVYIYYIREVRRVGESDPLAATVALEQLALPLAVDATQDEVDRQRALARDFSAIVKGCDDIERAAAEIGSTGAGSLGKLRVADLPPRFRSVVLDLKIGQPSPPLRTDQGFHVLMVCERIEAKVYRPDRNAIAEALGQQRLNMMSRRLLRDLRRDANIDVR